MIRPPMPVTLRAVCVATAAAAVVAVSLAGGVSAQKTADPAPGTAEYYTQKVEPILDDNCYSCHAEGQSGGLRLDSYSAILKGGGRGAPIVPGDPDTSLLIQAIRRTGTLKMPPKHALEPGEVDVLVAWVKAGAQGAAAAGETVSKAAGPAAASAPAAGPAVAKVSAVTTAHPQGAMSDAQTSLRTTFCGRFLRTTVIAVMATPHQAA